MGHQFPKYKPRSTDSNYAVLDKIVQPSHTVSEDADTCIHEAQCLIALSCMMSLNINARDVLPGLKLQRHS